MPSILETQDQVEIRALRTAMSPGLQTFTAFSDYPSIVGLKVQYDQVHCIGTCHRTLDRRSWQCGECLK